MLGGILAIFAAYLIGSFPTAYLITRMRTGQDIRELGSGNVGAHNVYEHLGLPLAIITGVVDVIKGILAFIAAQMLILHEVSVGADMELGQALLFLMGAGLAVIIGHIWPITLKFKGGNGIATTLGVLLMLMTKEVLIAIAIAILIITITRNPILSINLSLLVTIPVTGALFHGVWYLYVGFSLILIAILVINFLPTMRKAISQAGTSGQLAANLMRIDQEAIAEKEKNGSNKRRNPSRKKRTKKK